MTLDPSKPLPHEHDDTKNMQSYIDLYAENGTARFTYRYEETDETTCSSLPVNQQTSPAYMETSNNVTPTLDQLDAVTRAVLYPNETEINGNDGKINEKR